LNRKEYLEHGENSGYFIRKVDYKVQTNNSGSYIVEKQTMEYNDYSLLGSLYFGGGWGKLKISKWTHNLPYTHKDTITINGKVKFNGEFSGELDFQSFKYEDDNYSEYKLISGKVMIGLFDATQKYWELVI